jgi:hypothetical protein
MANTWRKLANAGGVRPSSREFAQSSPRTGEQFAKNIFNLDSLGLRLGLGLELRLSLELGLGVGLTLTIT